MEPEQLVFVPELNPIEGCMHSGQIVDSIRHLYLGKQPLLVKQCSRYFILHVCKLLDFSN